MMIDLCLFVGIVQSRQAGEKFRMSCQQVLPGAGWRESGEDSDQTAMNG